MLGEMIFFLSLVLSLFFICLYVFNVLLFRFLQLIIGTLSRHISLSINFVKYENCSDLCENAFLEFSYPSGVFGDGIVVGLQYC